MLKRIKSHYLLIILIIILAACQAAPPSPPEPVVETLVVTEVVQATPVEVIQVVTPTPEPAGPRTLVVCLDEEPDAFMLFYRFSATPDDNKLAEAIEDGPIDQNSYDYQPVILQKLPSLADGDATLTTVTVSKGDTVVDASGEVVTLDPAADPPIMLVPSGGDDPVPYQGGNFELDQLTVTFKLLPDLKWSDGAPLTAADSVFSFNLIADPESWTYEYNKWRVESTASYEAIDDVTIEVIWVPGYFDLYYPTLVFRPRPEHIWGQYSLDEILENEEFLHSPVGWGPYEITEWVPDESITLHKNPQYFRAGEGLPRFDWLIMRFTSENANSNIAALLSGECDLVSTRLDDQVELLLELHEAGELKASFTTGNIWEHIDFGIQNTDYDDGYQPDVDRPDFFSDLRTRQAFIMCMDRQALVDAIFFGQSLVPESYVPPQHPLYNPEVRHYKFDVNAASALLEEVGWLDHDDDPATPRVAQDVPNVPDGTLLEVEYETTSATIRQQATAIIKDSLAQCGIKANIQLYDSDEWFGVGPEGKLFGRRYDLGQFTWRSYPFPPCDLYLTNQIPGQAGDTWISIQDGIERTFSELGWLGENQIGFTNYEYDRACSAAMNSLPGQPEYEAAHLEAQRIFAEQLPSVPLFLRIKSTAMRPDMCGVIMDPTALTEFWNIEEFDYGEGCEE